MDSAQRQTTRRRFPATHATSVRTKLLLGVLLGVFLPLLVVVSVNILTLRKAIETDTLRTLNDLVDEAVEGIDTKLRGMKVAYRLVNLQAASFLEAEDSTAVDMPSLSRQATLLRFLGGIESGFELSRVRIYFGGNSPVLDNDRFVPLSAISRLPENVRSDIGGRRGTWTPAYPDPFVDQQGPRTISFIGPLLDLERGRETEAVVSINMNANALIPMLRRIPARYGGSVRILAEDGSVVAGTDGRDGTRRAVTVRRDLAPTTWRVVASVPYSQFLITSLRISLYLLIGVAAAVALSFGFAVALAGNISRRIDSVVQAIIAAGSTDTVELPLPADWSDEEESAPAGDELDYLRQTYGKMTKRLQFLIGTVYEARIESVTNHLLALQSQIKSHFLYNTLESINSSIQNKDVDRAKTTISALSKYLRQILRRGPVTIPLSQELSLVRSYISLERLVYAIDIELRMNVPSDLEGTPIVKFTLQPLVENAIIHGIRPTGGKSGKITITAAREDDAVRIDVSDDGVGMSAQAAHRLTSSISETRSAEDDHFGLYAVQQRLKLEFGKQATLTLASEEPVGTEVSVRVPSPSKVRE